MVDDDPRIYQALALPNEALEKGGLEILRAGIIGDELYVSAVRAFEDAGKWGEVLGDIARRLAAIYAAQVPGITKHDATVAIVEAFASEMGARPVKETAKPRAVKTKPKTKSKAKRKMAAKAQRRKRR
jgi:hypothetical protein